eukprot:Gb_25788 [translate_table: standard]
MLRCPRPTLRPVERVNEVTGVQGVNEAHPLPRPTIPSLSLVWPSLSSSGHCWDCMQNFSSMMKQNMSSRLQGILALPATMKIVGLILGLSMLVLVPLLVNVSVEFLLRFSKAGKVNSYGGVMADAFGCPGRILVQICVVVKALGILMIYMIIIGDVVSGTSSNGVHHAGLLEGWFGVSWWTGRTAAMFFTTFLILVPLACFRHVDSLKFSSALSVALAVVFVVITAGITVVKLFTGDIHMAKLLPSVADLASFWKLFTVVPVIVTACICHYTVHPIQNELKKPSEMQRVVQTSLALCPTLYLMTSVFCYLLFGDQTMADVLANFDTDLGVPYSVILNDIVHQLYDSFNADTKRFVLITAGVIGFVFMGATLIPNIWDAFQFTGATVAICIGFIFPSAIALRDIHGISTKKDKCLALVMIILAVISSSIAVSSDFYDLFKKSDVVPSHS